MTRLVKRRWVVETPTLDAFDESVWVVQALNKGGSAPRHWQAAVLQIADEHLVHKTVAAAWLLLALVDSRDLVGLLQPDQGGPSVFVNRNT
ncbi:MAG: hypothetical protein ACJ735_07425 [Actinomycetes bacterium]